MLFIQNAKKEEQRARRNEEKTDRNKGNVINGSHTGLITLTYYLTICLTCLAS